MRIKTFLGAILLALSFASPALSATDEECERFRRGNEAYNQGHYEMAIIEYRAAITLFGDHFAQAQYNTGVCHYKLGRKEESVKWYRAARTEPSVRSENGFQSGRKNIRR